MKYNPQKKITSNMNRKLIYKNLTTDEEIEFSNTSIFLLTSRITGLGTPNNEIYFEKGIGQDGESFIGSTLSKRYITFQITIIENLTENRNRLYRVMSLKDRGYLAFFQKDIARLVYCDVENIDYVESPTNNSANISINLVAKDGIFYDYFQEIKNALTGGKTIFHYDLIIKDDTILFDTVPLGASIIDFFNYGDIACGCLITFTTTTPGGALNPKLTNRNNVNEYIRILYNLQVTDVLEISTFYGDKYVKLNGVERTDLIDFNSTFLQLKTDNNSFVVSSDNTDFFLACDIEYREAYLGV